MDSKKAQSVYRTLNQLDGMVCLQNNNRNIFYIVSSKYMLHYCIMIVTINPTVPV